MQKAMLCDTFVQLYPQFNDGFATMPLEVGHAWVVTSHRILRIKWLILDNKRAPSIFGMDPERPMPSTVGLLSPVAMHITLFLQNTVESHHQIPRNDAVTGPGPTAIKIHIILLSLWNQYHIQPVWILHHVLYFSPPEYYHWIISDIVFATPFLS